MKIVFDIKKATRLQVQQFMTTHIERTETPKNCDPTKTHLNRDLISHPEGVDRTKAIINRIESTGVTVRKNSVVALQVMLSATHEGMKELENTGKLDQWADDNLKFLREIYGTENVVAATLHLDEFTPHIHATVVPIVIGKRRTKNEKKPNKREKELEERREQKALEKHLKNGGTYENFQYGKTKKRRYTKKDESCYRLCADDLYTTESLYQARVKYHKKVGIKYGFDYGEDYMHAPEPFKNKKKHKTTQEYYVEIKNEIPKLERQQKEILSENAELEKQQKKLKKVSFGTAINNIWGTGANDEIKYLEKKLEEQDMEIQTLKERNDRLSSDLQISKDASQRDAQYIQNLKHENKKLKGIIKAIHDFCSKHLDKISLSIIHNLKQWLPSLEQKSEIQQLQTSQISKSVIKP